MTNNIIKANQIPEWFINKQFNATGREIFYNTNYDFEIVKETEKAYLIKAIAESDKDMYADCFNFWIPKSIIEK